MYRLMCVLIAVATLAESRNGIPSVYDDDDDDSQAESREDSQYYDRPTPTHSDRYERHHKRDEDGYTTFLEDGTRNGTCKKYKVAGGPTRHSKLPQDSELYGPHLTDIQYISARPSRASRDAVVKVLWGGVGHHFALIRFKSDKPNENFLFKVQVCW